MSNSRSVASKSKPSENDLLGRVARALHRLGKLGWADLFNAHGLDISAKDLRQELLRPLPSIQRQMPGFEDFALEGTRGIEPGRPAHSLLFHAFASPQVVKQANGKPFRGNDFPTPAEIEAVENLVYGIAPPSLGELRVRAGDRPMAIVVFASEYRPAIDSVHRKHADHCFSRVGVARVGTAPCEYLPHARGYLPFVERDEHAIRVLPCRYAAYIAVQLAGQPERFGPFRFQTKPKSDGERLFWVPIHKLFGGKECLRGHDLTLTLKAQHLNEKLRRAHRALAGIGHDTGWHIPDLDGPPFVLRKGLAEFSTAADDGEGLLVPVHHPTLVEEAQLNSKRVTYLAPRDKLPFRSSVIIDSKDSGARAAPEYVHVRHRLEDDGLVTDLNDDPEMLTIIEKGGFKAVHYIDHTADGCIDVTCPELALELPRTQSAYSLITAVDYFPLVRQQELMQWWNQSVAPDLTENIWPSNPGPPEALCDNRTPANQNLTDERLTINADARRHNSPRKVFDPADDTIAAIVGLLDSTGGQLTRLESIVNQRSSWLTDGAAGVFAPGWDASIDRTDESLDDNGQIVPGVTFFNNYGLGSPFPEDAMLCAALSSFWPAAAPDITRSLAPGNYATATPLIDDQLGWDGNPAPRLNATQREVEYRSIAYSDYVATALKNGFNFHLVAQTTTEEYVARTLVMARAYASLGAVTREQKRAWALFSFKPADPADKELAEAQAESKTRLATTHAYRFQMFRHRGAHRSPGNHRNELVQYDELLTVFADPQCALLKDAHGRWIARRY